METPHEQTDACGDRHCHIHMIDEPAGVKPYIICFECNHVYQTARALRRAYRRVSWEMMRNRFGGDRRPWVLSTKWEESWVTGIIRILTVRAKRIYFCQECVHDF